MQKAFHRAALLCALLCFAACSTSSSSSSILGKSAPLAQLYSFDGDQNTIESYRGKTVVLLFWAQWCSRSQRIIKQLNDFALESNVTVVAVNIDKSDKLQTVKNFLQKADITALEQKFSGNDIYDEAYVAFDVGEVPTVFILDSAGNVRAHGTSYDVIEDYFKL